MGTWGLGPFDDDGAADFVGGIFDQLMRPVDQFMSEPAIDETFWPAYAALASMNALMRISVIRPWSNGPISPTPIVNAMMRCAVQAVRNEEITFGLLERLQPVVDEFAGLVAGP